MNTTLTRENALRIATSWVDAWNVKDLNKIMSHYSEDIEMISPLILEILPESLGILKGKDTLREYFVKWIGDYGPFELQLVDVYSGLHSLAIHVRLNQLQFIELFGLDEFFLIKHAVVNYRCG